MSEHEASRQASSASNTHFGKSVGTPHLVPPKQSGEGENNTADNQSQPRLSIPGLSESDNNQLVRKVAEVAATAATVAARDATQGIRKSSAPHSAAHHTPRKPAAVHLDLGEAEADAAAGGGHDAPNWSRTKSAFILLSATLLYAVIAEILVDTVDIVLESVDIDEKFLGITLFALVPNTTEFLVRTSRSQRNES